MKIMGDLEKYVKLALENKPQQSVAHRWGHLDRVRQKALELARVHSNVDLEILEVAALLHDIDQPFDRKKDHVALSIKSAKGILHQTQYPVGKIELILKIIGYHSTEELPHEDISIEARILFDADKLDGVSALGIARVFALCGQRGIEPEKAITWYEEKIKIALENMKTEEGKRKACKLLPYVRDFLSRMKVENNSMS